MDLNAIFSTIRNLALIFAAIIIGELIPPLHWLHDWMALHKGTCMAIVGTICAIGFVVFMATTIELTVRLGRSWEESEVEQLAAQFRENQPGAMWRKWAYRFRGEGYGGSYGITIPIKELKDSVQSGQCWSDPVMTRMVIIAAGALVMALGICGIVFVLSPPGLKFVVLLVASYAAYMITTTWWRA
ncbi:MAG TPA: hypothetical protein V6D08_18785 [Candidatus Obscuribacterales bacterium]